MISILRNLGFSTSRDVSGSFRPSARCFPAFPPSQISFNSLLILQISSLITLSYYLALFNYNYNQDPNSDTYRRNDETPFNQRGYPSSTAKLHQEEELRCARSIGLGNIWKGHGENHLTFFDNRKGYSQVNWQISFSFLVDLPVFCTADFFFISCVNEPNVCFALARNMACPSRADRSCTSRGSSRQHIIASRFSTRVSSFRFKWCFS